MNVRRCLAAAWILALFGLSLSLRGQAERCEVEAQDAAARLRRIKNDQPDLSQVREQLQQTQQQQQLNQSLRHQSENQCRLLQSLRELNWSYLEWEAEGFYLECEDLARLQSVFPKVSLEGRRGAGLWP